mgnify:CR=1 FL=1
MLDTVEVGILKSSAYQVFNLTEVLSSESSEQGSKSPLLRCTSSLVCLEVVTLLEKVISRTEE